MARKSRYTAASEVQEVKTWKPALYIRLSREDGDKAESDSVANQRMLLSEFVAQQPDMSSPEFYLDDGYTGTNFDRPEFQRMLQDLKAGKVNCVIVKDLSRLGRNYIGVGEYLETVFPLLDVRFIALNDALDNVKNPQAMNNLVVPFKNIINDEYCRDISSKVRSSLDHKRRQGKFIGSFASYGYLKDPNDRNQLLVDEPAATVVRDIFAWFLSGMSIMGIAKRLNQQGIPNPSAYKRQQGFAYHHPAADKLDGLWPTSSVRRILKNKLYIGTMVQGKNTIKSYKLQISVSIPEADWIEVCGTHEAIISEGDFKKVQSLLARDTRTAPAAQKVYLFSGFVRCADCGRSMNRKHISQPYGDYHYFICSTFKKMDKSACTKHTIRSDRLEQAVLEAVRRQIALAVDMDALISKINSSGRESRSCERLEKQLAELESKRPQLERMKLDLYPDWKTGAITGDEYQALKARFDKQLSDLDVTLSSLRHDIAQLAAGVGSENAFLQNFTQYRNVKALTREILVALVDMIYVHEGGDITIKFKFSDAYRTAAEYLESRRPESA